MQLDGPVQAGEGLYGFTLFEQAGTEVGMVVGDVRLQCDDAPEVGEALVLASRIYFNQPDQVDNVGRLGEVLLELAIKVLRLDEFSRAMEFHRMVERGLGVGELHAGREIFLGKIDQRQLAPRSADFLIIRGQRQFIGVGVDVPSGRAGGQGG